MESIEKLRKLTICDKGEEYTAYLDAGDIADEIEREHKQRINELNGTICELDGRIGSYERRNTELNDALKAICKHFGVSVEWSAEDAAKKVLDALERDYMRLPCDADGVPIHLGDELDNINKSERYKVTSIGDNGYIRIYSDTGWIHSSHCRHVKLRTLTDVLADLFDRKMSVTDAEHEISELLGGDAE